MSDIRIEKLNETYISIKAPADITMELYESEEFTFMAPNYRWSPKYKNGLWDGKIKMFNLMRRSMYAGLASNVSQWAGNRGYSVEYGPGFELDEITRPELLEFIDELKLPFTPNEHQIDAVLECFQRKRALIISPTGSGKSLILYILSQMYGDKKILLIVPTVGLVKQMVGDFQEYGIKEPIHQIMSGAEKDDPNCRIYVSTWQSAYKMPRTWFQQFGVLMGDEAHKFKATSLIKLMESACDIKYRFGFSGTLDGTEVNELTLKGLFGEVIRVITTAELMKKGLLSQLFIHSYVLKYPDEIRKITKRMEFQDELGYLLDCKPRNQFIVKLTLALKGNTLILFNRIAHGKLLLGLLEDAGVENLFYVAGETSAEDRETIRQKINTLTQSVTVGSSVWTEGTNIPNIDNIVFVMPYKSQIRVLQSIGRGLRKSKRKSKCTLHDIGDDLSWKSWQNHTLKMQFERLKLYAKEQFPYKQHMVPLKNVSSTLQVNQ